MQARIAQKQLATVRQGKLRDRAEVGTIADLVDKSDVLGERETVLEVATGEHVGHDVLVHLDQLTIRSAIRKLPDVRSLHAAAMRPGAPGRNQERFQRRGAYQPLAVIQFWDQRSTHIENSQCRVKEYKRRCTL